MTRPPLPAPCLMLMLFAALAAVTSWATDEPAGGAVILERVATPVILPDEALSHAGEECTVEFKVENGRKLDDKDICFLNSLQDHREKGNFTAVIFRDGLARFAADGVTDPADAFLGKTIRVSGLIAERGGQAQIVVESPKQIVVVEAKPVGSDAGER